MKRLLLSIIGVLAVSFIGMGAWTFGVQNPQGLSLRELGQEAGEAYIYAFPMLVMDQTRANMLAAPATDVRPAFEINRLSHIRHLPRYGDDTVVRPNLDTLYSIAWLDLTEAPAVLRWPEMGDRYWLFQVLDGTTDVAGAPGTRTVGSGPGAAMISGPDWEGPALPGMMHIKVESRTAWILGRIATSSDREELEAVHALQDQFSLSGRQLSDFSLPALRETPTWGARARLGERPAETVESLNAEELFWRFTYLAQIQEKASESARLIEYSGKLQPIVLSYGRHQGWGPMALWARQRGLDVARERLAEGVANRPYGPTGWRTLREGVGDYGDDYALRAGVAMVGLGANLPEDAIYPTTNIDSEGRVLDGRFDYRIRFEPGSLPPVKAFWSITAYDADGFIMNTMTPAYLSHHDIVLEADGGLTVTIGAADLNAERFNHIPVAPEAFQLTARLYLPGETALSGTWEMPRVERVGG